MDAHVVEGEFLLNKEGVSAYVGHQYPTRVDEQDERGMHTRNRGGGGGYTRSLAW